MDVSYVSPVGYIELDNEPYSLDYKTTRSREITVPKEDLAFYFETYVVPKYGLGNLNVNNVASFMKDLEMNWTKLDSTLKGNVLDILADGILNKDTAFKTDLLNKLNSGSVSSSVPSSVPVSVPQVSTFKSKSKFNDTLCQKSKSTFGLSSNYIVIGVVVVVAILLFLYFKGGNKSYGYPKMF